VVSLAFAHEGVRTLMGKRGASENSINSVTVEAPSILLIRKERFIRFAEVSHVGPFLASRNGEWLLRALKQPSEIE
jgi:hypothetical protein